MAPPNSNSWKQYIHSLPGDDEGNKNVSNFTEYCTKFDASKVSKLRDLVEDDVGIRSFLLNGDIISHYIVGR